MEIALRTARQLYRRGAILRNEIDDFAGDLLLHVVRVWPKFDGNKSSDNTFLNSIMRRAAVSLLRKRYARKRNPGQCVSFDGVEGESFQTAVDFRLPTPTHHEDLADIRHDLEFAMDQMTDELRAYCALLMVMTRFEIVRMLHMSRYQVAARICEIRKHFEEMGLAEYL
ncbi:MAG TPA: sigma factor [Phycisphaerae bacterium]|nr:sigma factor [Phycisphaerae bacterium]